MFSFAIPWTVALQALLSMEFPKQEYWSGLPFPFPRHLPDPGIEPRSPALQADSLPSEPSGKPTFYETSMSKDLGWYLIYIRCLISFCKFELRKTKRFLWHSSQKNFHHWDIQNMQHQSISYSIQTRWYKKYLLNAGRTDAWATMLPSLYTSFLLPAFQVLFLLIIFLMLHILLLQDKKL